LRWIFEALSGGDLSGINPAWFCDEASENPEKQLETKKRELDEVTKKLRDKKHVIVGHNLFTDLAFVYNTFMGTLPRSVKHFQEDVHKLFPIVIDTKYLATHGTDSMNPRANLKELLQPFKKIHVPLIVLHEQHTAYGSSHGKEHEAGYDSVYIHPPFSNY
jgi:poly(A)-specific ribonuclease